MLPHPAPPKATLPAAATPQGGSNAIPLRRTLPHRIWRTLPPVLRRRLLARTAAWLAPRAIANTTQVGTGIAIAGEIGRASGLGEGARLMAAAARGLGVPVWTVDIPPPATVEPAMSIPTDCGVPHHRIPAGIPLIVHVNAPLLPLALLRLPRGITRRRQIIGYWAWELPDLPAEWRPALACVNEVWVPSRFTASAVEPHLPGRVVVVPPALAVAPPRPSALGRSAFGLPEDAVVVLVSFNLASSLARKNPFAAIAAFHAAFGERRDRILVLKIAFAHHAPEDFAKLAQMAQGPNIRLETRVLPPADCHALTACADIVLSLHRSEGFGLVLAEAMLLGKAVIATGWSGNTDFMDSSNAALVNYRLVPTRDDRSIYRNSLWAHPDPTDAVDRLRHLADDEGARVALGQRAHASASLRLTAQPVAAALRGLGIAVAE